MQYKIPSSDDIVIINNLTRYEFEKNLSAYLDPHMDKSIIPINQIKNDFVWTINVISSFDNDDYTNVITKDMFLSPEKKDGIVGSYGSLYDGAFFINNKERGYIQVWDCKKKKIEIIVIDYDQYFLVQEIYAVIRWLIYNLVISCQGGLIHSSAVEYNGQGILIIGNKGSGKTTLLTALLNEGAKYISSDRTFYWKNNDYLNICGWICTYRADKTSLNLSLDKIKQDTIEKYIHDNRKDPNFIYNDKFRFPPGDFLNLMNFKTGIVANLTKIVVLDDTEISASELNIINDNQFKYIEDQLLYLDLPNELNNTSYGDSLIFNNVEMFRVVGKTNPGIMAREILNHICKYE